MSMLAERKRKQKWSLNPRGKDWAQDSNKFGQKLLEKMGWQQGKGLGAKEDGITEHIKVSHKNDSKGMGYKESDNQWTEHEANFSALLESLTGEEAVPKEIKLNSLEKKSQASRVRVHYHKFTRGKDLSRYSEKDLANIFGKKSLDKEVKECKPASNDEDKSESTSKFLRNAGSMRDYFKKKLPNFGKSAGYFVGGNGVLTKGESDSESEIRPGFGLGYVERDVNQDQECTEDAMKHKNNTTFVSYLNGDRDVENDKKIKKKRKSEDIALSPKKKSKKDIDIPLGVSNPAFDPLRTPIKVVKHVLNPIEENSAEIDCEIVETEVDIREQTFEKKDAENYKSFNKKSRKCKESGMENPNFNAGFEEKREKKKKLADNSVNLVDSIEDLAENAKENPYEVKITQKKKKKSLTEPCASGSTEENPCKVKSKRKKFKATLENPSLSYSSEESFQFEEIVENCQQNIDKKKKKEENSCEVQIKRKRTDRTFAIDNPEFDPSDSLNANEGNNAFEVKRKMKTSKKTKEETGVANPALLLNGSHSENEDSFKDRTKPDVNNIFEVERKKKKSKKAKREVGVANPALDLDNSLAEIEETSDQSGLNGVNNTFEVERKKKRKDESGVVNAALSLNGSYFENEENCEEFPDEISSKVVSNTFQVERKKKKSKKAKEKLGVINPALSADQFEETASNNIFEVERRKKSKKVREGTGVDNAALKSDGSLDEEISQIEESGTHNALDVERKKKSQKIKGELGTVGEDLSADAECDLMLNVVSTPVVAKSKSANSDSVKRRKSVRFSDITQERFIPNNDALRSMSDIEFRNELFSINAQVTKRSIEEQGTYLGIDNVALDNHKIKLEENLESISRSIETYQAQVENDINERKLGGISMEDIMIGDVGNPHGEHEKLSHGTKLKFKYAGFHSKTPFYQLDKTGAKKAYKHLIKGDIIVNFRNTNLHEIDGYAVRSKSTS